MSAIPETRSLLFANLICIASMLVWAAGLPAADMLIGKVPPLILTAARTGIAAAVLIPIWIAVEGVGVLRQARWGLGILIGGTTIGFGALLLVVGQSMTNAVTVAIAAAASPLIGMALEIILDGRRMTVALLMGLMLSLIGGGLALRFSGAGANEVGFGRGAFLCLVSVSVFTLGSRLTVTAFPTLTPLGRTTITLTGAATMTGIAALAYAAAGASGPDWALLGWAELGALAVFAIGGMAISQLLWIMSVGQLGIGLASLHINATPFYVMLILLLFGAAWSWPQAIAAAVVGLGVLVAQGVFSPNRT
jgi:drug/metabolite transporter (DMT)-like permease